MAARSPMTAAQDKITVPTKDADGLTDPRTGARDLRGFVRITNRAEKGQMAGEPFMDSFDGKPVPEAADSDDENTWLKPGESIVVTADVAVHLFGDVWDSRKPEKDLIINRYGGYQYDTKSDASQVGRSPALKVLGPPTLPDVLIQKVDQRGRPVGPEVSVIDHYVGTLTSGPKVKIKRKPQTLAAAADSE